MHMNLSKLVYAIQPAAANMGSLLFGIVDRQIVSRCLEEKIALISNGNEIATREYLKERIPFIRTIFRRKKNLTAMSVVDQFHAFNETVIMEFKVGVCRDDCQVWLDVNR